MQENKYRTAELDLLERRERALDLINEHCRGDELFNTMAEADVLNYRPCEEGDCVQFARNIADSRIFNRLIELGFIPRKWYQSSVCEWSGPGYFAGPVTEHYSIKELF